MTATPHSELQSRLETLAKSERSGKVSSEDADAIRTFIAAYDPNNLMETPPGDESTLKTGTCNVYTARLTETARSISLVDATADEANGVLQDLMNDGKANWTVHGYSTALRKFYAFHDCGPDPEDITKVETPNGSSFDPDDVLTRDEIHEMLDAAGNPRDRAVFALLIYTGMRNNALRTLRVGDVDVQEGTWKVNDEMTDGLKGVEKYGKKRPLLGARGPVREWLSYHPDSSNPDAYLITGRPKWGHADPSNPVAGSTIRRVVERLVENADNPAIERKPTHPHMMRHNFVTICKRDYDLPDETVKYLIGHSPASKVMETTYSHLSDEDHIERAEVAAGIREESEDGSALTPTECSVCGEPLPADAKACPACGEVFTPDAKAVEEFADETKERITDSKGKSPGLDAIDASQVIDAILDDPEAREQIAEEIDKLGE